MVSFVTKSWIRKAVFLSCLFGFGFLCRWLAFSYSEKSIIGQMSSEGKSVRGSAEEVDARNPTEVEITQFQDWTMAELIDNPSLLLENPSLIRSLVESLSSPEEALEAASKFVFSLRPQILKAYLDTVPVEDRAEVALELIDGVSFRSRFDCAKALGESLTLGQIEELDGILKDDQMQKQLFTGYFKGLASAGDESIFETALLLKQEKGLNLSGVLHDAVRIFSESGKGEAAIRFLESYASEFPDDAEILVRATARSLSTHAPVAFLDLNASYGSDVIFRTGLVSAYLQDSSATVEWLKREENQLVAESLARRVMSAAKLSRGAKAFDLLSLFEESEREDVIISSLIGMQIGLGGNVPSIEEVDEALRSNGVDDAMRKRTLDWLKDFKERSVGRGPTE